jgi:hypothetical protein
LLPSLLLDPIDVNSLHNPSFITFISDILKLCLDSVRKLRETRSCVHMSGWCTKFQKRQVCGCVLSDYEEAHKVVISRLVLSGTEDLHAKIEELTSRIQDLEAALTALQVCFRHSLLPSYMPFSFILREELTLDSRKFRQSRTHSSLITKFRPSHYPGVAPTILIVHL